MLIALEQKMCAYLIRYVKIGRQGLAGKAEDKNGCI
jgi:hypothetical protein